MLHQIILSFLLILVWLHYQNIFELNFGFLFLMPGFQILDRLFQFVNFGFVLKLLKFYSINPFVETEKLALSVGTGVGSGSGSGGGAWLGLASNSSINQPLVFLIASILSQVT